MIFGSPESQEWYAKRCLLYIRVSTDEQARKGYSLGAQLEELETFAKHYAMKVVGVFTDDGVSARKEVRTRKGLMALLECVKRGETDYILFIKLDRWFRSVKEYYKVQEILDEHKVNWKSILEDYDTSTTNGRLNLNIRLSVAQDESDRTSDRIKFVNENRVKHGGAVTGSFPLGLYSNEGKVHVNQQEAYVVRALFEHYSHVGSVRGCIDKSFALTGKRLRYGVLSHMFRNRLYIGEYRGITDYCKPLVDRELFDTVQQLLLANAKTRERKLEYVFSGLIRCPVCGYKMTSSSAGSVRSTGKLYIRYRCAHKYIDKICDNGFSPWEKRIEDYLLTNVRDLMRNYVMKTTSEIKKAAPVKSDFNAIKRRLSRLQTLYLEELIEIDAYRAEYAKLSELLTAATSPPVAVSPALPTIEGLLDTDFESTYRLLTTERKNVFWKSFIKHINAYSLTRFDVTLL